MCVCVCVQGIGWEYVGKPTSPTNSPSFSPEYDYFTSSTITSCCSPTPSPSSPTFSRNSTPFKGLGTPSGSSGCRSKTPSESSTGSGSRSLLLEEFRCHMNSFEDLSEIKGHILEFAKDQVKWIPFCCLLKLYS